MTDETPFFIRENDVFIGQDPARGPWSADHCHAGPVAGLIARAVEQAVEDGKFLTRLTIDLVRPVPLSGIRIATDVTRSGRRLATVSAVVRGLDDRICATATSLHLAEAPVGAVPTAPRTRLKLAEATSGSFPVEGLIHGKPCFADFIDIAYPPGESKDPGPTTLWMKTPPLLADDDMSSFQRLCPLADCGNGISRNEEIGKLGFMNADLTIVAHRQTTSDWLATTASSDWHDSGLGLATAVLQDEQGPVATALQTLILNRFDA